MTGGTAGDTTDLGRITRLTASEVHGTGADTMTHGTGTPGVHGITAAGTALGIAGTTHGTTAATGADGMIHGMDLTDTQDGTAVSGGHIMQDGTADGTHTGTAITAGIRAMCIISMSIPGKDSDMIPALTKSSADVHPSAADSELHRPRAETFRQAKAGPRPEHHRRPQTA